MPLLLKKLTIENIHNLFKSSLFILSMFGKKCPNCNEKIKKNFDFCPSCGGNVKSKYDSKDYGLLGKKDFEKENSTFVSTGDSFIDKLFQSAVKMLEKQMRNFPQESSQNRFPPENQPRVRIPNNLNVQFFVNGKRVFPGVHHGKSRIAPIKIENKMSNEKMKELSRLPKKEPLSKLRRLGRKVIYEIEVPGVENIEDILINRLENSIEIKALSKDNVYFKTLNVNLPIIGYHLENGNLILELVAR